MVRLQPWCLGKCGVPLHSHYSQVHSDFECSTYESHIELFKHLLYLKAFNCVQHKWLILNWIISMTGCLNVQCIHVTANKFTTNNVVSFLFQIWKLYIITTIDPWSQCLGQESKIFFVTPYLETKSFKTMKAKFCRKFNSTIIPWKVKFVVGYTNFKLRGQ